MIQTKQQRETLQSSSKALRDADMQTKSRGSFHMYSAPRQSPFRSLPSEENFRDQPELCTKLQGQQQSWSTTAWSALLFSLLSPRFPPLGQSPVPAHFQINLDTNLALSFGTEIQFHFPKWSVDTSVCNCLTCATDNTWNWKRSWVIFLAALITLLYWHQLVLYWSTPSGPKSNLCFTVYLPAVYFQYFSELVEWAKAGLLQL